MVIYYKITVPIKIYVQCGDEFALFTHCMIYKKKSCISTWMFLIFNLYIHQPRKD